MKYEFEQISVPNLLNLNLIDVSSGVWMAEVMASKNTKTLKYLVRLVLHNQTSNMNSGVVD